jgi:phosphate uptake regulator
MKDPVIDKILKEVAKEFNLNKNQVEEMYLSAYRSLKDRMNEGEMGDPLSFRFVQMPFLGKFVIKMNNAKYFKLSGKFEERYPFYKEKRLKLESKNIFVESNDQIKK